MLAQDCFRLLHKVEDVSNTVEDSSGVVVVIYNQQFVTTFTQLKGRSGKWTKKIAYYSNTSMNIQLRVRDIKR